jgi:cystathionine beta-lyase/cystathionine gamma-synthase
MLEGMNQLRRETRAVHPPVVLPVASIPLETPIYQGHLFAFEDADAMAAAFADPQGEFMYSRIGNPTVRSVEEVIAELEGGAGAVATGSGMGAINAVLMALLRSGDHVIAQHALYGATHALLRDLAERWGLSVSWVSGTDPAEIAAALRPETTLLVLETIANPTTQVADLPALIGAVRGRGVLTMVDNTFATPMLCRPIEHGADIVVHSVTKFLSGHGDVLAGAAVFATEETHRKVWHHHTELGASADPHSARLVIRGLATLPMRVARHCETALTLARRLAEHPAVERVRYPGLPGHPQHEAARRVLDGGFGGVLSFELSGGREAGRMFIGAVQLAALAVSLGSVKTLVMHPASTSHRRLSGAELAAAEIGAGTVRVSVGLEHPDDLWADFTQALDKLS